MRLPTGSGPRHSATNNSSGHHHHLRQHRRVAIAYRSHTMATMDNWIKCIGLAIVLIGIIVQPAEGELLNIHYNLVHKCEAHH